MPIFVPTSGIAVHGVRIYLEDLAQVRDIIARHSEQPVMISLLLRETTRPRRIQEIDDLKNYPAETIRQVGLQGGNARFNVDLSRNEVVIGVTGPVQAVHQLADFSKDLERLPPPKRLAYMMRPRQNDPYRVELHTESRADLATRATGTERHRANYTVAVISAVGGAAGGAAGAVSVMLALF